MSSIRSFALLLLATVIVAQGASAQVPARDASTRLREVLPADVAQRVLARIADARARQLPAVALENRALKFAAKGVAPLDIERSINEQAQRMESARSALSSGRGSTPAGDEIEAGAEAMRKGVDGASVAALAQSAPRDRSLAVPLFVIGSLTDRGLPSDQAWSGYDVSMRAVGCGSRKNAANSPQAVGQTNRPAETGRDLDRA